MARDVTQLLDAIGVGNPKAAEELLPLVYDELRRLAACKMATWSDLRNSSSALPFDDDRPRQPVLC
jgi:hypothetical protein